MSHWVLMLYVFCGFHKDLAAFLLVLNMAVERMFFFPSNSMLIFRSYVNVYQRETVIPGFVYNILTEDFQIMSTDSTDHLR